MKLQQQTGNEGLARELGQSIILLALTGSSVGGFLGMVAIAAHALGR
ncbi:MAG: hypothetical protein ABR579_07950 [Actinomycetota bacterium]